MAEAMKYPTHIFCQETGTMRWPDGRVRKTRESCLFYSMHSRCKVGGSYQKKNPSYIGVTASDNFKDFQFFADWCNKSVGWNYTDDHGKHFSLDKDILIPGNRQYSEVACVFVPQRINTFFSGMGSRGIPAQLAASGRYYGHSYDIEGKCIHIGSFDTLEEAVAAVKRHKATIAYQLIDRWSHRVDERVIAALEEKATALKAALVSKVEILEAANVPE